MSDKEYKIGKKSVDRVFPPNHITHISLSHNNIADIYDTGSYIQKKIMAQVTDATDKAICDAIIRYADEHCATDLFLIDEEFIKSAIENEVRRRKGLIK